MGGADDEGIVGRADAVAWRHLLLDDDVDEFGQLAVGVVVVSLARRAADLRNGQVDTKLGVDLVGDHFFRLLDFLQVRSETGQ